MVEPLDQWDADYIVTDLLPGEETGSLEFKSAGRFAVKADGRPDSETKLEIAKQVCAFSNARDGFLVFGITDDTPRVIDGGVPITINGTPTKDWAEKVIPSLVFPPVAHCDARLIRVEGAHNEDRAILAISIPLSESRPHWVAATEAPYIRTGTHSNKMSPQTMLDMATRGDTSVVDIVRLFDEPITFGPRAVGTHLYCNPMVQLVRGTICDRWALDVRITGGEALIPAPSDQRVMVRASNEFYCVGTEPLFPGRITHGLPCRMIVQIGKPDLATLRFHATLSAAAAAPVRKTFRMTAGIDGYVLIEDPS